MGEEDEKRCETGKVMAVTCVRNTKLEELHAGLVR